MSSHRINTRQKVSVGIVVNHYITVVLEQRAPGGGDTYLVLTENIKDKFLIIIN